MLTQYHIEIMLASLGGRLSPRALAAAIQANLHQDRIAGQVGHDEFHFDNNAFEKSYAYMEAQRALTLSSLQKGDAPSAWAAFGRMTHTAQDFYAHSNYISLWLARFEGAAPPSAPEVDPVDPDLTASPSLRSGRIYLPLEALYIFKSTRAFALRWLPRDSHAWMNLDSPAQGFKFDYAMQAAIQKTVIEYDKTTFGFSDGMCRLILDR